MFTRERSINYKQLKKLFNTRVKNRTVLKYKNAIFK